MAAYAQAVDDALAALWRAATEGSLTGPEGLALIARGGYGRRQLAPFSDIDIALVAREEGDPLVEATARRFFRLLSDCLLKDREFEVGYAYHLPAEAGALPQTSLTALLDARLLCGDRKAFSALVASLQAGLDLPSFLDGIRRSREQALARPGCRLFALDPDLKQGAGGLRDLHFLRWLARACFHITQEAVWAEMYARRLLSPLSYRRLREAEKLLLAARHWLHVTSGRPTESLARSRQEQIARLLNYGDPSPEKAAQQFLADYYALTSFVSRLCSQLWQRCWQARLPLRRSLFLERGEIVISRPRRLSERPEEVLRLFTLAAGYRAPLASSTQAAIAEALPGLPPIETCPAAIAILRGLLRGPEPVAPVLRDMARLEVLGWCLPELGEALLHRLADPVHEFTVGEHALQAVEEIEALRERPEESLAPYRDARLGLEEPELLLLAALLHDLGKLREGDHADNGAALAGDIAARLGLGDKARETLVFLVRRHLVLAEAARLRDPRDPKTASDLALLVATRERLDLLFLLTYGDSRAVGASVWNDLFRERLAQLHAHVSRLLSSGAAAAPPSISLAQSFLLGEPELRDVPAELLELLPPSYLLNTAPARISAHLAAVQQLQAGKPAIRFHDPPGAALTEILVCALDEPRPGLLSRIVGVLYAHGVNTHAAEVYTLPSRRPIALDLLWTDLGGHPLAPYKRQEVATDLVAALAEEGALSALLAARGKPRRIALALERVVVRSDLSEQCTVLEFEGEDMEGFLFQTTRALASLGLNIRSAHISTRGAIARDVFYVTDLSGEKLDPARASQVRTALLDLLT
jgi:[protein-PII] uridylyltransferase